MSGVQVKAKYRFITCVASTGMGVALVASSSAQQAMDAGNPASRAPPIYPREELCNGIGGVAVVIIEVDAMGNPIQVHIERSTHDRALDRAAVEAAKGWKFNPSSAQGAASTSYFRVPVEFNPFPTPDGCPKIVTDVSPVLYHQGLAREKAPEAGEVEALRKAAVNQDPQAQVRLGELHEKGEGVSRDPAMAMQWFGKAAVAGDGDAEGNLGLMYEVGYGVPMDRAKSLDWFTKAAAHGNADGEYNMGLRKDSGDGTPIDRTGAALWIQKAAAQGHPAAKQWMATHYQHGLDVPKGGSQGVDQVTASAEHGDANAQRALGYHSGEWDRHCKRSGEGC